MKFQLEAFPEIPTELWKEQIAKELKKLDFKIGRLKTGTPPRLDGTTINYENLEMQSADENPFFFSYLTKKINAKQVFIYIVFFINILLFTRLIFLLYVENTCRYREIFKHVRDMMMNAVAR